MEDGMLEKMAWGLAANEEPEAQAGTTGIANAYNTSLSTMPGSMSLINPPTTGHATSCGPT